MMLPEENAAVCFRRGLDLLESGQAREGLASFKVALDISNESVGDRGVRGRYLSYYGLSVGLTGGNLQEAMGCCRAAVRSEPYRFDLWWNLARVARLADRNGESFRALKKGLRLAPDHAGMRRELRRAGVRRRPVVPFLSRKNRLNVILGRLTRRR